MDEMNKKDNIPSQLGEEEETEAEQLGKEAKQVNIDQSTEQQDFLEIAQGSLKVASTRLNISEVCGLALQMLKNEEVQTLLKIKTNQSSKEYCK